MYQLWLSGLLPFPLDLWGGTSEAGGVKAKAIGLEDIGAMSRGELEACWERLAGSPAPSVPLYTLRLAAAQLLQERRHGKLKAAVRKELFRLAADGGEGVELARPRPRLAPGTRLVREWNGRTLVVEALEDGAFAYGGKTWSSLTQIARHVTGAHWSGPRFFGLKSNG